MEDGPVEAARAAGDWLEAFKDWPADIVVETCRRWRQGPPPRPFPPSTPGELTDIGAAILTARRALVEAIGARASHGEDIAADMPTRAERAEGAARLRALARTLAGKLS